MESSYRPLQPAGQQPADQELREPTSNRPTVKAKRPKTAAACDACRKRRSKCDGLKPSCSACSRKGSGCSYSSSPGERRKSALKTKNKALEKDLDSMLEIYTSLSSRSESDAQEILRRIRSNTDVTSVLNFLRDVEQSIQPSTPPAGKYHNGILSPNASSFDPVTGGDGVHSQSQLSPSGSSAQITKTGLSSTSVQCRTYHSNEPTTKYVVPSASMSEKAISAFFTCSGKLFHVFTREQSVQVFNAVYQNGTEKASNASMCKMCAIAAVGSQYSHDEFLPELRDTFYDNAKSFLEDCIDVEPLQAVKVCVLLAMYNIMDKSTVALSYIKLGLSLARCHGLHTKIRALGYSHAGWVDCKKVWRTLTFMDSWLSSTLGYASGLQGLPGNQLIKEMEIEQELNAEDIVQTEMAKIAVLNANILERIYAFKDVSILAVKTITNDLRQWHANLPPSMHLATIAEHGICIELRRTIYFVHLMYLGAMMLLYRRIMAATAQKRGPHMWGLDQRCEEITRYVEEGLLAATQSARILGLLLSGNGIFKRCWLCIFQAFTSCTIILYGVAQKQLHGYSELDCEDDLIQAEKCLQVLSWCGQADCVARRFHDKLQPYYDILKTSNSDVVGREEGINGRTLDQSGNGNSISESSHAGANLGTSYGRNATFGPHLIFTFPPGETHLHTVSRELLKLVGRPFGNDEGGEETDESTMTACSPDFMTLDAILLPNKERDWRLEVISPFSWQHPDWDRWCEDTGEERNVSRRELRSDSPQGYFVGSKSPCGWRTSNKRKRSAEIDERVNEPSSSVAL